MELEGVGVEMVGRDRSVCSLKAWGQMGLVGVRASVSGIVELIVGDQRVEGGRREWRGAKLGGAKIALAW